MTKLQDKIKKEGFGKVLKMRLAELIVKIAGSRKMLYNLASKVEFYVILPLIVVGLIKPTWFIISLIIWKDVVAMIYLGMVQFEKVKTNVDIGVG